MAGAAIRGDLGWKRLEERREEKVLYGRRLQRQQVGQANNSKVEEYWRADREGKMALVLGRSIEGGAGADCVMEEVLIQWWQRRKELVYGRNPC